MAPASGPRRYEVIEGWGELPEGWSYKQVAGVTVDAEDRVYLFNRGEHPVIVYDRRGRFLRAWGEGLFRMAHAICPGPDGTLYLVDGGDHTVRVFTPEGRLLRTLGDPGVPAEEKPFNKPTGIAFAPSGEFYVSDGYGNSRVHRFARDGEWIASWGRRGDGPGEFHLPHGVRVDREGRVFVADRENGRIQIFTADGEYLDQWTGFRQPCDVHIDREGAIYVPELQSRLTVLSPDGEILARWGGEPSREPGAFVSPHAAWTDSQGDLYVGEVLEGQRIQKFNRRG
jgi:DNA-binding beta-propeller fold protein YncE